MMVAAQLTGLQASTEDEQEYNKCAIAMYENNFSFKANRVKVGTCNCRSYKISEKKNYIVVNGEDATIKIDLDGNKPWKQSDRTGFSIEGKVSNLSVKTDSKDNVNYSFTVSDGSQNASIDLTLYSGGKYAEAYVYPSFNSPAIEVCGNVFPK